MVNIKYNEYHIRALLLRDDIDFNKFTKLELIDFLNVSIHDNEKNKNELKKCKEVIDKVTNDIQQLIDDTKNKTVISLGQFIPKLEVIQDELNGSNDMLKEVK